MEPCQTAKVPRVSVGMPVYNGHALFPRAIESILNQSFQDFEIIISDNASSDETVELIQRYAEKDRRIRVFVQERTSSPLWNFRFVLEQASGEFFFWAPHDDWWDSGFIAGAVKRLDACPQAAAVMGTVHYVGKDGKEFLMHRPPYHLDDPNTFRRIRSYLRQNVTDNLYYSVFRRSALKDVFWSVSLCPEKVIIMNVLSKGAIVDGWDMEYSNQYSFKTQAEVSEVFQLPPGDLSFQAQVFYDLLRVIKGAVTRSEYIALAITLFFRQRWYRFIVKLLLHKLGVLER